MDAVCQFCGCVGKGNDFVLLGEDDGCTHECCLECLARIRVGEDLHLGAER